MTTIAQHNRRLKSAGLPTIDTLTRRVLATYGRASKSIIEQGARWYDEQGTLAAELSGNGITVEQTASVIAALSPRTTWARNVAGAVALIRYGEQYPGIMRRNYNTALDALDKGLEAINGPKTNRFARNIMGDREAVTVDVWAARIVGCNESQLGRAGVYDAIEVAYQRAARKVGHDPASMQAITWIVARNGRSA